MELVELTGILLSWLALISKNVINYYYLISICVVIEFCCRRPHSNKIVGCGTSFYCHFRVFFSWTSDYCIFCFQLFLCSLSAMASRIHSAFPFAIAMEKLFALLLFFCLLISMNSMYFNNIQHDQSHLSVKKSSNLVKLELNIMF